MSQAPGTQEVQFLHNSLRYSGVALVTSLHAALSARLGKAENAAHRQASVRNWQGCERITPRNHACASWGPHRPTTGLTKPQFRFLRRVLFLVRREGTLERPPVRDAANGLASASHYLGLRDRICNLGVAGLSCGGGVVAGWCHRRYIYHILHGSLQYGDHTYLRK